MSTQKNVSKVEILNDVQLAKLTPNELDKYLDTLNEIQFNEYLENSKALKSFDKQNSGKGKLGMYKKEAYKENETAKEFRKRIRTERNNFISGINNAKGKDAIKKAISEFNTFYKKCYNYNDYTVSSLAQKNSDLDTLQNITTALQVIKRNK